MRWLVAQLQIRFTLQWNRLYRDRQRQREHWLEVSCWMGWSAVILQSLTSSALMTRFFNKLVICQGFSFNVAIKMWFAQIHKLLISVRAKWNWSCRENKKWIQQERSLLSAAPVHLHPNDAVLLTTITPARDVILTEMWFRNLTYVTRLLVCLCRLLPISVFFNYFAETESHADSVARRKYL